MSDGANLTWKIDFAFLSLTLLIIVPLVILVGIIIIRSLLKGNYVPVLAAFLVTGLACVVMAIFFVGTSSVAVTQEVVARETMARELDRMQSSSAQRAKREQLKSDKVNTAPTVPIFIPVSEAPLVARKPTQPESNVSPKEKTLKTSSETLPEWVFSGLEESMRNRYPVSGKMVFRSGLFATRDEALENALVQATQKLQSNLKSSSPQYRLSGWTLTPELARQTAYRRVYYQTVDHNFGNILKSGKPFKQDMYRAYLEVEDAVPVRQKILKKWRKDTGNQRVAWLGGGFGLITLFCMGIAVYLRATHDPATIRTNQ